MTNLYGIFPVLVGLFYTSQTWTKRHQRFLSLTLTVCNSHTQTVTLWQRFWRWTSAAWSIPLLESQNIHCCIWIWSLGLRQVTPKRWPTKTNSHPAYTLNLSTPNKVRLGVSEGCPNISHFVDLSIFMSIHFINIYIYTTQDPDLWWLIMTLFLITWINKNRYIPDFLTVTTSFGNKNMKQVTTIFSNMLSGKGWLLTGDNTSSFITFLSVVAVSKGRKSARHCDPIYSNI